MEAVLKRLLCDADGDVDVHAPDVWGNGAKKPGAVAVESSTLLSDAEHAALVELMDRG